ncbi:hypothetical protein HY492_03250, partial [Candidatus Woesearchaeota archaeon]|nr:hypothetical protein [Candidatus Woesearchaeota archaeon]
MIIMKTLLAFGVKDRQIWIYDTFNGMTTKAGCLEKGMLNITIEEVMKKVLEEITELGEAFEDRSQDSAHFREEIGDVFFVLVNLARHAGIDPETLVKENVRKYLKR